MIFLVDSGILLLAAIISAAYVLLRGFWGFLFGVFIIWGFGIVRIEWLYYLDPNRDAAMLDAAWIIFIGWFAGVVWCLPFLIGKLIYNSIKRKKSAIESADGC